jgi:hypothetical protein
MRHASQKPQDINLLPGRRSMALVAGHDCVPSLGLEGSVQAAQRRHTYTFYTFGRDARSRQLLNALIDKRIHIGAVH